MGIDKVSVKSFTRELLVPKSRVYDFLFICFFKDTYGSKLTPNDSKRKVTVSTKKEMNRHFGPCPDDICESTVCEHPLTPVPVTHSFLYVSTVQTASVSAPDMGRQELSPEIPSFFLSLSVNWGVFDCNFQFLNSTIEESFIFQMFSFRTQTHLQMAL